MAEEQQEFDLSMPAVVDKYKSAGAVANGMGSDLDFGKYESSSFWRLVSFSEPVSRILGGYSMA